MSLFDNLKYQNIDLGNRLELETLPVELISLYWVEAHSKHPEYSDNHLHKCKALANWGYGRMTSTPMGQPFARRAFLNALAKYNQ